MDDRWKRGIMLFKTVLDLSQYDFQFPRYRCVKKRVIFNSSTISVLFARFNQSLPPLPHHSTQCILETLLHSIKIRKTLNRCNSGRIDFCSTNEIRLEAWNFALSYIISNLVTHAHLLFAYSRLFWYKPCTGQLRATECDDEYLDNYKYDE